jgi:hypothetical protein
MTDIPGAPFGARTSLEALRPLSDAERVAAVLGPRRGSWQPPQARLRDLAIEIAVALDEQLTADADDTYADLDGQYWHETWLAYYGWFDHVVALLPVAA